MRDPVFQDAIAFAGADWENQTVEGRSKLLDGYRIPYPYPQLRWEQLPPTIKQRLANTLIKKKKNG